MTTEEVRNVLDELLRAHRAMVHAQVLAAVFDVPRDQETADVLEKAFEAMYEATMDDLGALCGKDGGAP